MGRKTWGRGDRETQSGRADVVGPRRAKERPDDRGGGRNLQSAIRNRGESGQALVVALLALTLGVLLVVGFLYFVSTSQRASQAAREQTTDRYSADAGVEYGLWQLQYGGLTSTLTATNSSQVFSLTVNGQSVVITVTRVVTP